MNAYKSVLTKYSKESQKKIITKKNGKQNFIKSKYNKKNSKNEIIYSYMENMNNKKFGKERKNYETKDLYSERNNRNNIPRLYKKEINEFMKLNDNSNYNNRDDNIDSFTSRMNYKSGRIDDSVNNKYLIFENSSYFNNINSNSKYISLNSSNIVKKRTHRSIEITNDKNNKDNVNSDTKRLIQKYKLFPFLKKDYLRSKENSGMMTLSNTNTHTPRSKRKILLRKNKSILDNSNKRNIKELFSKNKKK